MQFVFDLDGTICFKGQALTEDICAALDVCHELGHEIIFASARPIRDLLPMLPAKYHPFSMVGGNGAFCKIGDHIEVTGFDKDICRHLLDIIETDRIPYLLDSSWDYCYNGEVTHPIYRNIDPLKHAKNVPLDKLGEIVKMILFTSDKAIQKKVEQLSVNLHIHQNEGLLDLSPEGIDKWSGLQQLGIKEKEFIAFGNDSNDICMFTAAKESICIGNNPIAQEFASFHSNAEDAGTIILHMAEKYSRKLLADAINEEGKI